MDKNSFESIEDYVSGLLSPNERLQFEEELVHNEELASTFRLYKEIESQMQGQIEQEEEIALRQTLSALNEIYFLHNGVPVGSTMLSAVAEKDNGQHHLLVSSNGLLKENTFHKKDSFVWLKFGAVAVFIGAIITGAVFFFQNNSDFEKITSVNKNQVPKPFDSTIKKDTLTASASTSTPVEDNVNTKAPVQIPPMAKVELKKAKKNNQNKGTKKINAQQAEEIFNNYFTVDATPKVLPQYLEEPFEDFKNNRYNDAISKYKEVIAFVNNDDLKTRGQQDSDKLEVQFNLHYYLGQSYLAVDSTANAISELQKASTISLRVEDKVKAKWYLALAYIKTNQQQKALTLLKYIADINTKNLYQQRAQALLNSF